MNRLRTMLVAMSLLAAPGSGVLAQDPMHTVSGVVFDSVAGAPLGGAIVQVVQLDSASQFTKARWWGTTDPQGRFKVAGIPTGRSGSATATYMSS